MPFKIEREEHVNKTFRLPKSLIDEMEDVCKENSISLNKLVLLCIRYALDDMEKEKTID